MFAEFISISYKNLLKPILFKMKPDYVHEKFGDFAQFLGRYNLTRQLTKLVFDYQNPLLEKTVLGIKFKNPVGIAAGYDYNAFFVDILPYMGVGFSTVGTVTFKPYAGNTPPMFTRLIKSKSILVNKGFKNDGAQAINTRIQSDRLKDVTFGVSVGNSNLPEIDTVQKAINDYLACFEVFKTNRNVKFFELNISCPNIGLEGAFLKKENLAELAKQVKALNLEKPIFLKMPNEIPHAQVDELVHAAVSNDIHGFIFSNLVKNRNNPALLPEEVDKVKNQKGSFSGKPTKQYSDDTIKYLRNKYGTEIALVGTGGIFTPQDAKTKIDNGADLVQLITGLIFEGPQLIHQINRYLATNGHDKIV